MGDRTDHGPDYSLVVDEPPRASNVGHPTLDENLRQAAEDFPGDWVRVVTYGPGKTASIAASDLRQGRRGKNRKPGRWEFRSGKLEDGSGNGVWARYLGPAAD